MLPLVGPCGAVRSMIGGWFVFLVRRNRRIDPMGHGDYDDDADLL